MKLGEAWPGGAVLGHGGPLPLPATTHLPGILTCAQEQPVSPGARGGRCEQRPGSEQSLSLTVRAQAVPHPPPGAQGPPQRHPSRPHRPTHSVSDSFSVLVHSATVVHTDTGTHLRHLCAWARGAGTPPRALCTGPAGRCPHHAAAGRRSPNWNDEAQGGPSRALQLRSSKCGAPSPRQARCPAKAESSQWRLRARSGRIELTAGSAL